MEVSAPIRCGRKQPEYSWWAGVQGVLAGGEEVGLVSGLLLDDLYLQILHDVGMFPLESLGLGGPPGLNISDGC